MYKDGKYIGYIYQIINTINGKKYIGQTSVSIQHRWNQHINSKNIYIDRAIAKYGKNNFQIKELMQCYADSKEELLNMLNKFEILLIQQFNTMVDNGGYNVSIGGGQLSPTNSKSVKAYNMDGSLIQIYDSILSASRDLELSDRTIRLICDGKQSNYNLRYVFRYLDDDFDKYSLTNCWDCYSLYQFDVDGNLIKEYQYAKDVRKTYPEVSFAKGVNDPNRLIYGFWWSTDSVFRFLGHKRDYKNPIDVYVDGKYTETLNSIRKASDKYNTSQSTVIRTCKGEIIGIGNITFRFHGDKYENGLFDTSNRNYYNSHAVNQYTKENEYVATFVSCVEATKEFTNSKSVAIHQCCTHKKHYNTAYGYKWFFADDINQPDKNQIRMRNGKELVS